MWFALVWDTGTAHLKIAFFTSPWKDPWRNTSRYCFPCRWVEHFNESAFMQYLFWIAPTSANTATIRMQYLTEQEKLFHNMHCHLCFSRKVKRRNAYHLYFHSNSLLKELSCFQFPEWSSSGQPIEKPRHGLDLNHAFYFSISVLEKRAFPTCL